MKMYTKYKIVPFCQYHFVHTILSIYQFVRTILSATILSSHLVKLPNHSICLTYRRFSFLLVVMMSLFCPEQSTCKSQLHLRQLRCFLVIIISEFLEHHSKAKRTSLFTSAYSHSINEDSDSEDHLQIRRNTASQVCKTGGGLKTSPRQAAVRWLYLRLRGGQVVQDASWMGKR